MQHRKFLIWSFYGNLKVSVVPNGITAWPVTDSRKQFTYDMVYILYKLHSHIVETSIHNLYWSGFFPSTNIFLLYYCCVILLNEKESNRAIHIGDKYNLVTNLNSTSSDELT